MPIGPGTCLGPYEIQSAIGAGGMGEVYRARDTRLNRNVAIKVLPEAVAFDKERVARFQREAELLASLSHSNIAAIHGLEESGGVKALVMELVEGPTLADRIAQGAVPIDEALPIAKQIAEALEAAHEQGIIHRDLKPANIKVRPDGTVKVLDFGLAKLAEPGFGTRDSGFEGARGALSMSPTITSPAMMTGVGVLLGTAAYMSPEQAKGREVTKATDIFAFGAVLYELLTGVQAFHGEDIGDVLATVMKTDPDWSRLPKDTPPTIRTLLRRCVKKDRRQRLGDAGAVRIEIEDALAWVAEGGAKVVATPGRQTFPQHVAWVVAGVAMLAALAGWGAFAYLKPAPREAGAIRFPVVAPDGWRFMFQPGLPTATSNSPLAVSPDARRVAFTALGSDGRTQLWIRSLDVLTAEPLTGTVGGHAPFWSPDSRSLGFFADGKLKRIDIAGGPAVTLCDGNGFGATWGRDGVIVFNPAVGGALQRVAAAGGTPSPATVVAENEAGHRSADFLPDGRHFLYVAALRGSSKGVVYVGTLDSAERKRVLEVDSSDVFYSSGHILFLREATLMAQPFDAQRLEVKGDAFPIAEDIQTSVIGLPYGYFSASESGVLAYRTLTGNRGSELTWHDRSGKAIARLGDIAFYADLQLSPDAKQVAVSILDPARRSSDIWIYDIARGLKTRFTFDPADELTLIWSPDGKQTVFNSRRKGHLDLYQKAADGTGTEKLLFEDDREKYPVSWSPDGKFILYSVSGGSTNNNDLFVLPLSGESKPVPFVNSQFTETPGGLSLDGRWVVYASTESGRLETYVASFPGPGAKRQVSTAGGTNPRWSRSGSEIFYLAPDNTLMVAAVDGKGTSFEVGAVKPLFQPRRAGPRFWYDISPDGQRFLINTAPQGQASDAPITVVVNWLAGVKN